MADITHPYPLSQESLALTSEEISTAKPFIQANTIGVSLEEIKNEHIIPVYIKDNEVLISHTDFIEVTMETVSPFRVQVIQDTTIIKRNTWVIVEEVQHHDKHKLLYRITSHWWPYHIFRIQIHF